MSSAIFEVDASSFIEWTENATSNIQSMVNSLKEVRAIVYNFTAPLTPYDKGFLMQSIFEHSKIISDYPFFELNITMTGIDNPSAKGWDYALIQYTENFNHPIQGEPHYLKTGFEEAEPYFMMELERDYLSALGV